MSEKEKNNWLKEILPQLRAGVTIKVYQKIKEKNVKGEEKERIQIFEGIILAHKGGRQRSATITVRKVADGGIGVEKIFPIYSSNIAKIEFVRASKVRRAKLNFLGAYKKKLKENKTA